MRQSFDADVNDASRVQGSFLHAVVSGLASRPPRLDSSFLYDQRGSELFETITTLEEYYLTRSEQWLLTSHASELRAMIGPCTLVELGAGSARKTTTLLDAWSDVGSCRYWAIDICAEAMDAAMKRLEQRYPGLHRRSLVTSYCRGMPELQRLHGPATILFLGSSIGNLGNVSLSSFLRTLSTSMRSDDHFLVGLDLQRDPRLLAAAYDDSAGVTAAFTRNLFARMNRELGTEIPVEDIAHVVEINRRPFRVDIFAKPTRTLIVDLPQAGRRIRLPRGRRIRTETCRKFSLDAFTRLLTRHGLRRRWLAIEPRYRCALLLFQKPRLAGQPRSPADREQLHLSHPRRCEA